MFAPKPSLLPSCLQIAGRAAGAKQKRRLGGRSLQQVQIWGVNTFSVIRIESMEFEWTKFSLMQNGIYSTCQHTFLQNLYPNHQPPTTALGTRRESITLGIRRISMFQAPTSQRAVIRERRAGISSHPRVCTRGLESRPCSDP